MQGTPPCCISPFLSAKKQGKPSSGIQSLGPEGELAPGRGGSGLCSPRPLGPRGPTCRGAPLAIPAGPALPAPRPGWPGRGKGEGREGEGRGAGRGRGRFPPPGEAPLRWGPAGAGRGGAGRSRQAARVSSGRRGAAAARRPPGASFPAGPRPPALLPVPGVTSLCSAF